MLFWHLLYQIKKDYVDGSPKKPLTLHTFEKTPILSTTSACRVWAPKMDRFNLFEKALITTFLPTPLSTLHKSGSTLHTFGLTLHTFSNYSPETFTLQKIPERRLSFFTPSEESLFPNFVWLMLL